VFESSRSLMQLGNQAIRLNTAAGHGYLGNSPACGGLISNHQRLADGTQRGRGRMASPHSMG
jgi:hypothetical protein